MALVVTVLAGLVAAISLLLAALYIFFKSKYTYWKRRGVVFATPKFPLGNLNYSKSLSEMFRDIYNVASEKPFCGFWLLHKPHIMINDLNLVRTILVEDFHTFPDHGNYCNVEDDPLSGNAREICIEVLDYGFLQIFKFIDLFQPICFPWRASSGGTCVLN